MCDLPRTGCAWRTTPYVYVAQTSNRRVIMACELYCCLLPQCKALRTCRSGFPIATKTSMCFKIRISILNWPVRFKPSSLVSGTETTRDTKWCNNTTEFANVWLPSKLLEPKIWVEWRSQTERAQPVSFNCRAIIRYVAPSFNDLLVRSLMLSGYRSFLKKRHKIKRFPLKRLVRPTTSFTTVLANDC